jgi:hypothetical protein
MHLYTTPLSANKCVFFELAISPVCFTLILFSLLIEAPSFYLVTVMLKVVEDRCPELSHEGTNPYHCHKV